MMNATRTQGFTLIEMIMVILILGIIIGMSSSLLTQGLNAFSSGENIVNATWQGQIAMERMFNNILAIRSPADLTSITATNLAFTDTDNNTISFTLSGTSLTLTQNSNAYILADGVQSLTFSYFNKDGITTATPTGVRLIRVALTITQNGVNYTLTTGIYPRNLP